MGSPRKEKEIALKMAQKIAASGANVVISNWNIDDVGLGILLKKRNPCIQANPHARLNKNTEGNRWQINR